VTSRRVVGFSIVAGICLGMTALAAQSIAPQAPWAPDVDAKVAQLNKLTHEHHDKESWLAQTCQFPSAAQVGVEAYPGSLLIDWHRGGGSASDGDDVPRVSLVSKAPLKDVIAWYRSHYPNLKAKRMFETAGPGISFTTSDTAAYANHDPSAAVAGSGNVNYSGCNGMLAAPAAYQTEIDIYYSPAGK